MSVETEGVDLVVADERPPNSVAEAGVEREVMRHLDVAPGEFVAVEGRQRTVAAVAHARVAADGVALGSAVLTNAAVDPGDRVTVSKATVAPADRVTVAPMRSVAVREGIIPLASTLAGRPVSKADAVDASILDGALTLTFAVVDTVPRGPVLVTERTTVVARSDPAGADRPAEASLDAVGGHDEAIERLCEAVLGPLEHPERFERLGRDPTSGVLLSGPAGVGKTLLARAAATETDAHVIDLDAAWFADVRAGELGTELRRVAGEARARAPTLVVIDDLDDVVAAGDRAGERGRRLATQLRSLLDDLASTTGVAVLATARDPDAIDPTLRRGGRLDREIELGVPDREGRRAVLAARTRGVPLAPGVDLDRVAARTHGFVGSDLDALVDEAVLSAADEDAPAVRSADLEGAIETVEPSAMRGIAVDVPEVTYDDVGGLAEAKRVLARSVEWPLRYPALFEYLGTEAPRGILLYGPPGTGKTMLAKAVANATDANFVSVRGPEVLDKWVGESERAIRDLFAAARQNAPSVVFFDEVDAIAPRRGGEAGGSRAVERVVSQLLTEIDGLAPLGDVVVIGATNRPDVIDPALLRPGRFERLVEVGLPDRAARRAIFEVHLRGVPTADVDRDGLAAATEGYSGSDVAAVVREASLLAMAGYLEGDPTELPRVTPDHFARALTTVGPSAGHEGPERP